QWPAAALSLLQLGKQRAPGPSSIPHISRTPRSTPDPPRRRVRAQKRMKTRKWASYTRNRRSQCPGPSLAVVVEVVTGLAACFPTHRTCDGDSVSRGAANNADPPQGPANPPPGLHRDPCNPLLWAKRHVAVTGLLSRFSRARTRPKSAICMPYGSCHKA
ncbi:hypothetical protein BDV95DRAFT_638047, partial [Massariosphaeria phaeospora]